MRFFAFFLHCFWARALQLGTWAPWSFAFVADVGTKIGKERIIWLTRRVFAVKMGKFMPLVGQVWISLGGFEEVIVDTVALRTDMASLQIQNWANRGCMLWRASQVNADARSGFPSGILPDCGHSSRTHVGNPKGWTCSRLGCTLAVPLKSSIGDCICPEWGGMLHT